MADSESLTLAFLSAHPQRAARVLERLPGPETAALFARIPARVGGPVLAAMLAPTAARILSIMSEPAALTMLTGIGAQAAVAILRHVAEPGRTRMIEGLPTATAVASRLLLGYVEDSVGGWVDPDVVSVGPETTVTEALARVRRGGESEVEQLYVVDLEQRLLGVIDLHALVRAPEAAPVSALMRKPVAVLAAASPLASAAAHEGWMRSALLPVLERGGRLIGVLRRTSLARAVARTGRVQPEPGQSTVIGLLANGYWAVVSGLAEATLELLPRAKPVLPEER